MPTPPLRRTQVARWRWLLPAALLVAAFHFSPFGLALDRAFFDLASRHPLRDPAPAERSALVLVDDTTMEALGQEPLALRWPFPRAAFAALIVALDRAGAARIVMDFTFFERSESAEQDLLLAATAAAVPATVLGRTAHQGPVFWDAAFRRDHAALFERPRTGGVEFNSDSDGIARAYAVPGSLAAAALGRETDRTGGLLRWHGGLEHLKQRGVPAVPAAHFIPPGLTILKRIIARSPHLAPEEIARALAEEPALDTAAAQLVRGRTVFVGANAAGTFDVKPLPVGNIEPGILLHWTAWANLEGDGFIVPLPRPSALAAALLFAFLLLAVARRRPGLAVPVGLAAGFVLLLFLSSYAGLSAGWFFPPATPAAAALLALLGVVAENFWAEKRRKLEIQAMFGAYVDPVVVERLVRDPEAIRLGGELRVATVYFSDLAGFTDLSEKLSPEEMVEIVNLYLQRMSDCLIAHGAYIDKYIGDAVMAVFGAPQELPDHALSACEGALAAQQVLLEINAHLAATGKPPLAMRIGINTGEMIVGNLGSDKKKNYTVMGDAVNLASRLEGANKAFGTHILIGETTALRVAGPLATRPLTRLRVKGRQQAVEVHELLGHAGELDPQKKEFLQTYREGYVHYAARRFPEAGACFRHALENSPGDQAAAAFLEHAAEFATNPPPADWEPVLTLKTK